MTTVRWRNRARRLVSHRALGIGSRLFMAAVLLAIAPTTVWAAVADSAAIERARALVSAGQTRAAIELLKPMVEQNPQSELLVLALADAYRLDKNPLWGMRVLTDHVEDHPPACRARAVLAELPSRGPTLILPRRCSTRWPAIPLVPFEFASP